MNFLITVLLGANIAQAGGGSMLSSANGIAITPASTCIGTSCTLDVNSVLTSSGGVVVQSTGSTAGIGVLRVKNYAGTELMRVQQDGKVGIGVVSPCSTCTLHVGGGISAGNGTIQTGTIALDAVNNQLRTGSAALYMDDNGGLSRYVLNPTAAGLQYLATGWAGHQFNNRGGTAILSLNGDTSNATFNYGVVAATAAFGSGVTKSSFTSDGSLTLDTNANLQVGTTFYVGNGRVGIGVAAPAYQLDISGDARIGGQFIAAGTATVRGNAFSVGGSSFTVAGGSATVAYQMMAQDLYSTGYLGVGVPPEPALARAYVYTTTDGVAFNSTIGRTSGNNYSIWAVANGVTPDSNVGMYTAASGGTNNRGIWIAAPLAGANNRALYVAATASSAFLNGGLSVGGEPSVEPNARLHVQNGPFLPNVAVSSGSNSTSTGANAVYYPVVGSTVTLTVQAGSRVNLRASVHGSNTGAGEVEIMAMQGSTKLCASWCMYTTVNARGGSLNFEVDTATLAAGTYTFSLMGANGVAGAATISGDPPWRLRAEEIIR